MTTPTAPPAITGADSPLAEAKFDSLDEFLSRDPFSYQAADRRTIVRVLREQRAKWVADGSKGKATPARKVGGTTPKDEVDLTKLGL